MHQARSLSCPSREELERLAAGASGDEAISRHVESCAICQLVTQRIRQENALIDEFAGATSSTTPRAPVKAEWPKLDGYEVTSEIHRGGQGIVYRAVQLNTKRIVAVKTLAPRSPIGNRHRRRFEREIEVVAQLRHPHIVTLFDSNVTPDGLHYFVMEYVEGVRLGDHLRCMPEPSIRSILQLFGTICEAVHFAHQRGVIHRDLKPANILVDREGAPHVLDFGLAKALGTEFSAEPYAVTRGGEFLGTLAYASPEQVLADPERVDARADVYALGVVLYEMLTGRLPYPVDGSLSDVVRSITEIEPARPSLVRQDIDDGLEAIVLRALAKDPRRRYPSAESFHRDVLLYLSGKPITAVPFRVAARNRRRLQIAAALLLFAAGLFLGARFFAPNSSPKTAMWLTIPAPDGVSLIPTGYFAGPVVVSPDGTAVAFTAYGVDGLRCLWVRPLHGPMSRALPGTEGASFPFWSADSRSLGFFAKEMLYTVNVAGGSPNAVCMACLGRGGTWNRQGVILFSPERLSGIHRVAATGGTPQPVTTLDETRHTSHRWPVFCPDGEHFLFLAIVHGTAETESNDVYQASLGGGESRLVLQGSANAEVALGRLLYPRDRSLLAVPFDVENARPTGEPTVIATDIAYDVNSRRTAFSASQTGVLAFHAGRAQPGIQIMRVDRHGKELGAIGEPANFSAARISPDGKRIAATIPGAETTVWVCDIAREVRSPLPSEGGSNLSPVWSSDGRDLVYAFIRFGVPESERRLSRRSAMGGDEEVLYTSNEDIWPTDWSRDGQFLLFSKGKFMGTNPSDIWVLPLSGDRRPFPLVDTSFPEDNAQFSPDGKWVVYESKESGRHEVYIVPFNSPLPEVTTARETAREGRLQVSTNGGTEPEWPGDGKELFYLAADGRVMAVEITTTGDGLAIGKASPLFATTMPIGFDTYDASPDGAWFIVNSMTRKGSIPITLITNWPALLANR